MPFLRPTLSTLIGRVSNDIAGRLTGGVNAMSRSVIAVLSKVVAGAVSGLYGYLAFLAEQILPDTAEAEFLARHASNWGLRRKGGTPSTGAATATGANGTAIPAGTVLVRVDGARFVSTAEAIIAAGTAVIAIEAEVAGAEGNTDGLAELTFASPVAGVQAVATVTAEGTTGGTPNEDDDALRARLLQRIRNPAQGGSKADYVRWALEVDGVTRCWVYPTYLGAGSVGIFFVMDDREDNIPTVDDVAAVQAHIDEVRPVTAVGATVLAPEPYDIDFLIRVTPDTAEVRAAVVAELDDLFSREAEPGGTMFVSRESEVISIAAGESHHQLLLPSVDQVMEAGKMPRRGDVEFTA